MGEGVGRRRIVPSSWLAAGEQTAVLYSALLGREGVG